MKQVIESIPLLAFDSPHLYVVYRSDCFLRRNGLLFPRSSAIGVGAPARRPHPSSNRYHALVESHILVLNQGIFVFVRVALWSIWSASARRPTPPRRHVVVLYTKKISRESMTMT